MIYLTPVKRLFRIHNGSTPLSSEPSYWDGDIYWATPEDLGKLQTPYISETIRKITAEGYKNCGATLVQPGSLIITSRAPVGNLAISEIEMCTNQGCKSLEAINKDITNPEFYYYYLTSQNETLQSIARGSTFFEINSDDLGSFKVVSLDYDTQTQIADYLNRKTAELDMLIGAKQRLLNLLDEKKRALIAHAVTRGLNPDAPLKDSGIPWIGKIPQHWNMIRLRSNIKTMEQGWSPQCDNIQADENEWGVLKAGAVNGLTLDENNNKRLPSDIEPKPEYEISVGDILISRANTTELLGSAVLVKNVRPKLMLCDKIYRLSLNSKSCIVHDYLVLFLRSNLGRFQIEREANGASNSMQNIGQDVIKNIIIPIPPVSEQRKIIEMFWHQSDELDVLSCCLHKTIDLLKERRTALISEAVTGKLSEEILNGVETPKPTNLDRYMGENRACV